MDRSEDRRRVALDSELQETYDTRQAKQRASVKWLLSKAYNNRVPENLREPFYRDHEDQEHLKPQIVHSLANAELYCLGLANIYSDPNYHNLNHWGIIQALLRKGVSVVEPPDTCLTETVLIQTTPLKMSAHLAVIEAMMVLYAKEVVTPDRVLVAIQRFSIVKNSIPDETMPLDHEEGLLLWVNRACTALRQRIGQELDQPDQRGEGDRNHAPAFPHVKELKDFSNGVSLAALVSFYCPEELPWTEIVVNYVPKISDSMHNVLLVYNFCNRCLPCSVFHLMPEDVTYMQSSMKQNLFVFLADLFNVLEIHPVKCVRFSGTSAVKEVYPRNSQGVAHKRSLPQSISAIPDLRSNLGAHSSSFTVSKSAPTIQTSLPVKRSHSLQYADTSCKYAGDVHEKPSVQEDRCLNNEDQFVVHRGRGIPTLSSVVHSEEPLIPARLRPSKEKQNQDSKEQERGEPLPAAGRPSNWEEHRRTSYAGRRSRRNSVSDDSQLTIENFGGSQENLHLLGRNPDKEPAVHIGRRIPSESINVAIRTSAQDASSSGVELILNDTGYSNEKRDEEKLEKNSTFSVKQIIHSKEEECEVDGEASHKVATFADLTRHKSNDASKALNIVYMQQERENSPPSVSQPPKSSFLNKKPNGTSNGEMEKKTTTFAALPNNTTTWQQQSSSNQVHPVESNVVTDDSNSHNHVMASQLHNIRMKLEEKRRRIESEKRRMEVVMSKQRQKVGKAAFLQAVSKGKNTNVKTPESDSSKESNEETIVNKQKPQRPFSLQEIGEDVTLVEQKWLEGQVPFVEERKTPDIENMDLDQYQQSLAQMNSSLHEIEADIQRLATQQNQIQEQQQIQISNQHAMSIQQPQFYLHDQQVNRMMWNQHPNEMANPYIQQQTQMWVDAQSRFQKPQPSSYNPQSSGGFVLHDKGNNCFPMHKGVNDSRFHNGDHHGAHHSLGINHTGYMPVTSGNYNQHTSFQLHSESLYAPTQTPPSTSPQHRSNVQRISQLMTDATDLNNRMFAKDVPDVKPRLLVNEPSEMKSKVVQPNDDKSRNSGVMHAPIPTPPVDDMEPQSISFIGMPSDDDVSHSLKGLQISSGSRTYRIPSPTRPAISRSAFQKQDIPENFNSPQTSEVGDEGTEKKGFYISFDNDAQPKRPKPPLRVKKSSPKKERPTSHYDTSTFNVKDDIKHSLEVGVPKPLDKTQEVERCKDNESASPGVGLVIGSELVNPDPDALDEMERKKEKIMLLSLQRRQQQEEMKQMKEREAQRRREIDKLKQEERERKKEEERLRRAAILEQYRLKKAIEEAEREGKLLPENISGSLKPVPKLRNKSSASSRPRPKTIHVDSGSTDIQEGVLSPSRSKKGSTSNLTDTGYNSHMRRDYFRGSQDSLADRLDERRGHSLFRDSPDDGRGASPSRSGQLGRRGSYKTSRDVSEPRVRSQPKYTTYQGNFRGRKSNSLMNLSGSSTDQDSMVYRYTDTDSGLGRATPPRRAPSPGMSSMRHLPSPSGPGSLPPGLMTKRRIFDDGSSDISSTPSSMMEYTGPRLYKQPATKSNRGIMLNAVEYCVFPGVVNKEAKRRVLEEIARSESKHFLILFRDAGCQFRALYSYCPEREEVLKLYGTGPKQVNDRMFDKFFKYNSGGKCFSQVHTKHLTVTIDAFTIHNSLWQGKKVALPNKKDMALVI